MLQRATAARRNCWCSALASTQRHPCNLLQKAALRACCRLDFDEFHEQLWYTLHEWEHPNAEHESDDHIVSRARFHELDANQCASGPTL